MKNFSYLLCVLILFSPPAHSGESEMSRSDQELAELLLMNQTEFERFQRVSRRFVIEVKDLTEQDITLKREIDSALAEKNPDGSPNVEAIIERFRAGDFNRWFTRLSPGLRKDITTLIKNRLDRAAQVDCQGKDRNKAFCKKVLIPAAQKTGTR